MNERQAELDKLLGGADAWGGYAFPVKLDGASTMGMTLRDYFAGQAMNGWQDVTHNDTAIARACYDTADAMLKARGDT